MSLIFKIIPRILQQYKPEPCIYLKKKRIISGIEIIFVYLAFGLSTKILYHIMSSTAKKVLIAEDSSVIQNIASKVLQFQNYEITSAKNGKQVLKKLEKTYFDVILMDIHLPGMDGIDACKMLKKKYRTVKIIGLTTYDQVSFIS